ncbi:hypothetical protein [Winogradskya humida]|nr:hypothetical protein [Actinoplanes humidus]
MAAIMAKYHQLGDEPPTFNLAANDARYGNSNAHTVQRHGPDIPLQRDLTVDRTVEGRIYGDGDWGGKTENWSYKWDNHTVMNREINEHVRANWDTIRSNLAMDGWYKATFDAGHRVGEGYYNNGAYGVGPRQAQYAATSYVRLVIRVVPGSDPVEPFILTAFPSGLM